MTRYLIIILATMCCAHAAATTRIDASSEDMFNASLHSMKQELGPEEQAQLDYALMTLPFAGMQSLKDTPPDGVVKLDIKALDGMTADQIIELARKTVTVKIRVGPPPGLPHEFTAPLRPAPTRRRAAQKHFLWPGHNGSSPITSTDMSRRCASSF